MSKEIGARAKKCSRCGLTKVLACFYGMVRASGNYGWQAQCKLCHRETARASSRRRYRANPEKFIAAGREWRRKNKGKFLAAHYAYKARLRECRAEERAMQAAA